MPKTKDEEPMKPRCPTCKGLGKVSYPNEEYVHTNGQKYYGVTKACPACAGGPPAAVPPFIVDNAKRAAGDNE